MNALWFLLGVAGGAGWEIVKDELRYFLLRRRSRRSIRQWRQ